MIRGSSLGSPFKPLTRSGLRLGLTLIITLMVVSSPIFILVNPASAAAPSFSTDGSTSGPSTIGQDGSDFTIQALSSLSARPTNNIVNTNSFYDVVFLTGTPGAIKFIQVTFPLGTIVPTTAIFNEAEGIGPGFISQVSGQTVTYTVNNAVNVPVGTKIRLEFANINNPLSPSANYKVTVTTRNAANTIIDGPTQSTAYAIKQIGSKAIAESFMKRVTLLDNPAGNALGWNPDNVDQQFTISEPAISSTDSAFISIEVDGAGEFYDCDVLTHSLVTPKTFLVGCMNPVDGGSKLHYVVENLPPHVVS